MVRYHPRRGVSKEKKREKKKENTICERRKEKPTNLPQNRTEQKRRMKL